jgi:hypothetical protein
MHKKCLRFLPVIVVLLLVLLLPAACKSVVPSEFTKNEKLWDSKNLLDYNFTLQRNCFCPEDRRGPVDIQVRNGIPTSIVYPATGAAANADFFSDVDTVDEIMAILKKAYTDKAARVDVTYDAVNGFPLTIYIDVSELMADEEQGYNVTNFTANP